MYKNDKLFLTDLTVDHLSDPIGIDDATPCFAWKPAPDAVLYLMDRYGMSREDAVMIGDRDCDLASGRNAGVGSVHLICPIWPEDLQCDWRLDDFAHMLELL